MHSLKKLITNGTQFFQEDLDRLNEQFEDAYPDEVLEWGFETFGADMVLGTGFGPSGVFLIDRLQVNEITIPIFYLDTSLFFKETYELRDRLQERYSIDITRVASDLSLEDQAKEHGEELWKSNPNRCCYLRKVLPLRNYLADKKAWVTGVRRSQSETRKQTNVLEWDPENEVIKINPLANWTSKEVWNYINIRELPYNPLHDDGYPSIGCIPCTEPVDADDDERAGRWNGSDKTECGIHTSTQEYQNGMTGS